MAVLNKIMELVEWFDCNLAFYMQTKYFMLCCKLKQDSCSFCRQRRPCVQLLGPPQAGNPIR